MTHDYKRNGIATLFAALNAANGEVVGLCQERHRHQESWLNMVERFFRDLIQNRLRRDVFRDLEELIMAIGTYIDHYNESLKPFIWTARAVDILEKVKRARRTSINVNLHDVLH
jgi:hypothetical protein